MKPLTMELLRALNIAGFPTKVVEWSSVNLRAFVIQISICINKHSLLQTLAQLDGRSHSYFFSITST